MGQDFSIAVIEGEFADFQEIEDVYNCVMAFTCVFCAALAAGLTMGLLSLDNTKLEIKAMIGTPEDRANAAALLPLIKKHHLLLVTLMLFNSLANEALPIFLGSLVPNYLAVLISVVLVLICGEIVPSALFTGPQQLQIAARLANVVWFLLVLFYPVSYPLSRALDYVFGAEESDSSVTRQELEALMILQSDGYKRRDSDDDMASLVESGNNKSKKPSPPQPHKEMDPSRVLSAREVNIMTGILKLSKLNISNVMVDISTVFMIPDDLILDERGLSDILLSGFSRIPVYKEHREIIIGFLLVKTLAVVNPSAKIKVGTLFLHQPLIVKPNVGLLEMMTVFREGHRHLALVSEDPIKARLAFRDEKLPRDYAKVVGMVTLENVLEKILQEEIIDETDNPVTINDKHFKHGYNQSANKNAVDYLRGSDFSEKKLVLPDEIGTENGSSDSSMSPATYGTRLLGGKIYGTV